MTDTSAARAAITDAEAIVHTETWYGIELWIDLNSIRIYGPDPQMGWWSPGTRFGSPEEARARMTELDPEDRPRVLKFTLTREVVPDA